MQHRLARLRAGLLQLRADIRWKARDLAGHYGARLNRARLGGVTFIGVTGSAGKTTTKDLAAAILSTRGLCQSSPRSANEYDVVDRVVLATTRQHRFCVVEMGAPRPNYLDRPLRALRPSISALTIIEREHYSAYRSPEAIAAEKGKLIEALPAHGTAVLNIDDPHVRSVAARHSGRVVWVGKSEGATLRLLDLRSSWPEPLILQIEHEGVVYDVRTQLQGLHLALPVLTALGIALAAGMPLPDAIAALAATPPSEGRMQIDVGDDGVTFVRDDWKAPQWSFQAPLEFMREAKAKRKVVVIGSISDSAKSPSRRYPQAARAALEVAELVVLVGTDALHASKVTAPPGRALHVFANIRDAAQLLKAELRAGDLVLLKGTTQQDHLVRLMLDRRRPVLCWQADCGRNYFCNRSEELYKSHPGKPDGAALPPAASEAGAVPANTAAPVRRVPLVVGLGNPGDRYRKTAHNAGQRVL
ncbi:MAG: Mur ligase family protein, partial [Gammaproteobacteria bacterium]